MKQKGRRVAPRMGMRFYEQGKRRAILKKQSNFAAKMALQRMRDAGFKV